MHMLRKWIIFKHLQKLKLFFIYRSLSLNPIKFLKLRAHSVHIVPLDSARRRGIIR